MKLYFKTEDPERLKVNIIEFIESKELLTWSIVKSDGVKYLKHTKQWGKKGVIKLIIDQKTGHVVSEVLKFKNVTDEVKDFQGYYLGRFCELMLVNFFERFSRIDKK